MAKRPPFAPCVPSPDEGWAHAAVLVQSLNRRCRRRADGRADA